MDEFEEEANVGKIPFDQPGTSSSSEITERKFTKGLLILDRLLPGQYHLGSLAVFLIR
jgi:hypothetical protein